MDRACIPWLAGNIRRKEPGTGGGSVRGCFLVDAMTPLCVLDSLREVLCVFVREWSGRVSSATMTK
jgi:hypothetical protein